MVIYVKFVGSFRGVSGRETLTIKVGSPMTLKALVGKIVIQVPKLKSVLIDSHTNKPRTSMLVLVNGREISVLEGFDSAVNDQDEVVFVPVMHGG